MLRATAPSAHSFLRRATNRLHHRIDQTSVLAALTIQGVTLDLYRTAMQSLERAYREIDRLLLRGSDLCPTSLPLYTPRVPRINRDLIALKMPRENWRPAQPHPQLMMPNSEAAYLGMRYVVEGAQLGNRLIYSHLRAAFGDQLRDFGSFWMPGSVLQSSWPSLLKTLSTMESRESLAAAARTARATFRHMELYLAVETKEL
jgi:heme oxygenase